MMGELVSICIPTYNGATYLEQCLNSAISQSYSNIEIIIVDDKSTDNTLDILQRFASLDNRIQVFVNEINRGLVGNWNRCIEKSNGEWIKFLFQDDYLAENAVERMLQYGSEEHKFIVCTREIVFGDTASSSIRNLYAASINTDLAKIFSLRGPAHITPEIISKMILRWRWSNYIGEPTVTLIHKSVVNEVGYFSDELAQICDLEYWFRVSTVFGLFYIPETLAWFRVHNQATSSLNRKNNRDVVDSVTLLYQLSYGEKFKKFRNYLNRYHLFFLRQLLKRQIHRLNMHAKKYPDDGSRGYWDTILKTNPALKKVQGSILSYYFLVPFVLIRRFLSKLF